MKKTRLIFTALAVALSLGSFQMEAAKSAARQRFDDSLKRFKKCLKGKCTRAEKLKVARDLGIAALAVLVGGAIGTVAGKGAATLIRRGLPSPEAMGIYSTSGSAATGNQPVSGSAAAGARRRGLQGLSQGRYGDEPEAPADEDQDSSSDYDDDDDDDSSSDDDDDSSSDDAGGESMTV